MQGSAVIDGASCLHYVLNNGDVNFDDVIDVYNHWREGNKILYEFSVLHTPCFLIVHYLSWFTLLRLWLRSGTGDHWSGLDQREVLGEVDIATMEDRKDHSDEEDNSVESRNEKRFFKVPLSIQRYAFILDLLQQNRWKRHLRRVRTNSCSTVVIIIWLGIVFSHTRFFLIKTFVIRTPGSNFRFLLNRVKNITTNKILA